MSKIKVDVDVRDRSGVKVDKPSDLYASISEAGWSDDPGTGKAVLLDDGREVVNSLPHDPPVGFVKQESVVDQVIRKLTAHRIMQLQDDEVIDLKEEAEDFDIDEDVDPRSVYEILLKDEFPDIPPVGPSDDPPPPSDDLPPPPPSVPEPRKKSSNKPPPEIGGDSEA